MVGRSSAATALMVTLVVIGLLGLWTVVAHPLCRPGCPQPAAATAPVPAVAPEPAAVTVSPTDGARDVAPLAPVTVRAASGTLTDVVMRNEQGESIVGVLTPDAVVWKPAVALGYGRTYTVTATAKGSDGTVLTAVSLFSTLVPGNQTRAYLTTTATTPLEDGGRYGIGTVVVAHFDEPIGDRAAAQKRLSVITAPPVSGGWYWVDDQNAHWRPEHYFAPGTTVRVAANIYGAQLGEGLYGQEDSGVQFVIGDAHLAIADDVTKRVSVYDNGALVRTMPTSMGMGGSQTVGATTISFWTQPGVYTVMDKANPVIMDSSTYGLPINSRLGYKETIYYATRISTDGIYLHQLDATVWAQGNTDVSHGCLNLSGEDAQWFYRFAQPGDVVEVRNTGGEPLQLWQNGDWGVPWSTWLQGSALPH